MVFPDISIFTDKLGPIFEKYLLKLFEISFKSVIVFSLYKNSSGKSVEFLFLLSFSSIVAHVFYVIFLCRERNKVVFLFTFLYHILKKKSFIGFKIHLLSLIFIVICSRFLILSCTTDLSNADDIHFLCLYLLKR